MKVPGTRLKQLLERAGGACTSSNTMRTSPRAAFVRLRRACWVGSICPIPPHHCHSDQRADRTARGARAAACRCTRLQLGNAATARTDCACSRSHRPRRLARLDAADEISRLARARAAQVRHPPLAVDGGSRAGAASGADVAGLSPAGVGSAQAVSGRVPVGAGARCACRGRFVPRQFAALIDECRSTGSGFFTDGWRMFLVVASADVQAHLNPRCGRAKVGERVVGRVVHPPMPALRIAAAHCGVDVAEVARGSRRRPAAPSS